ncbi:MAG TPA: hypothetical protein VGH98_10235 [Gemmatimonadaceae bacterium]|jgi:hypothetical protein
MDTKLQQDVRWLKLYALCSTAAFLVIALAAFRRPPTSQKTKFEEIDVERINVVEKDGKLRLVISNRDRSPGPIAYGKPFGYPGGSRPGMIFFNDEGSENGGLTFTGKQGADGKYASTVHMSFDQYNEDQVIVLQYADENGVQRKGLQILDRANVPILDLVKQQEALQKMPAGPAKDSATKKFMEPRPGEPLAAQRLFVGRDPSKSALVVLSDKMGHPRLRMSVDSLGKASLDFLDASGKVTRSIGEQP